MPAADFDHFLLLGVAAVLAGAVNAVAGGGSLLSFPALLLAGYPSVTANVTNLVAMVPGYVSGTAAYRQELGGQSRRMLVLGPTCAVGAAAGTALLLVGPASAFDAVVPVLVLASCALLAFQPLLMRLVMRSESTGAAMHVSIFLGAAYGGYFGAGLGIILLALLGMFVSDALQRINALKGVLSLVIGAVSMVSFALFASVAWPAAGVMAAASVVGGYVGVGLARRLRDGVLRWGIVAYGVVLAVALAVR